MKTKLHIFFEETTPFEIDREKIRAWVQRVAADENGLIRSLNLILCSDGFLLRLNEQYLQHDTYTDIITFHYQEPGEPVEGELFISIERVKENALALEIAWQEELERVIIHGVLHLLGYGDDTPVQKEAMRRKEDYCLSLRA